MKTGVFLKSDRVRAMTKKLASLPARVVLVGVPGAKTARDDGPITNATLAYIHNFGAPESNIPAREFMSPGIRSVKGRVAEYFRQIADAELSDDKQRAERARHAAGLTAASAIKAKITAGPFDPLKESTLAARRRRGRTGTRPLIDTTQLRNSITYVIRGGAAKEAVEAKLQREEEAA